MGDIETFNQNGYVLIKNFFTEEESKQIVNFANTLETWKETPNKWMIFFEKEKKKSRKNQRKSKSVTPSSTINWGVSAGYHDASISVVKGKEIVFAGHAER